MFSFSPPSFVDVGGGDELNKAEVFWTNDFTDDDHYDHDHPRLANKLQKSTSSGILTALPKPITSSGISEIDWFFAGSHQSP